MHAAVDIGGTFTDVLLFDDKNGSLWSAKVPSSPGQPASAFIEGLIQSLSRAGSELSQVNTIVHGTTLVTNALLERKTARCGLVVTEGFRDLLHIARQRRPKLYDLIADRLFPLVPRELIREVPERIDSDGKILIHLDEKETLKSLESLSKKQLESLAVVFLFSFLNRKHEERVKDLAREYFPAEFIFLSSHISPEFREYERASTTVVAAAVAPKVFSYLDKIQDSLKKLGWYQDGLAIMHSGGGTLMPEEAVGRPHSIVESGPAAGIIATGQLAAMMRLARVISFDMGGTTAKAGLVLDGKPQYTTEYEVGGEMHHMGRERGIGYPVRFPMIDVAECGAGAGSIAWIDSGGHLKVGPQSTGADPGPACYAKGGNLPTLTDVYIVLGYLASDSFLGGEMELVSGLAQQAITRHIAKPLDMKLEKAAQGILTVSNANILSILRFVSVARGYDPRDFTLVAYGGAGPLHGTTLAEMMSIQTVIVPPFPGLFSAFGLLYADLTTDFVTSVMVTLEGENLEHIQNALSGLNNKAVAWFERTGISLDEQSIQVSADLRYRGQNYELEVAIPALHLTERDILKIQSRYNQVHEDMYGHSTPDETIQLVNLRLRAMRVLEKPGINPVEEAHENAKVALLSRRDVLFPEEIVRSNSKKFVQSPVYERSLLRSGHTLEGPAIIQERESTTLVTPGWRLKVDAFGSLIIEQIAK